MPQPQEPAPEIAGNAAPSSAPVGDGPASPDPATSTAHQVRRTGMLSDLRVLARGADFRKLFTVRLVSQCGDGAFQAGLAMLFFFAPENLATVGQVAGAFAVLLLPFTIVGPWAGVLLDRWRRRQVLAIGNGIRVVLALTVAALMMTTGVTVWVYALTLVTLSINRFLLSALSAGLPRVVPRQQLLMANSVTPTLGAAAAGLGGALGLIGNRLAPAGTVRDGVVLIGAALLFAAASALALRLRPDQLGPDFVASGRQVWHQVRGVGSGLVEGARYLIAQRTPAYALGVMAAHRLLFGANFIASLLISRNLLSDPRDADAGLATFAVVLAFSAVGFALAVVLTPIAHQRISPPGWILVCLTIGAASQALLVVSLTYATVLIAAVLLGLAAQGAKIAVDTIVQRDTADAYRGRAFALYDVLYNAAFVGAAALAAATLPDTGYSPVVFAGIAVAYLLVAALFRRGIARPAA